ncbi:MAG: GNAT family N-acetyltransferase [Caldilineaceae bacterium]
MSHNECSMSTMQTKFPYPLTPIDNYWTGFLGCEIDLLLNDSVTHLMPVNHDLGFWAISRRGGWVITAPPTACEQWQEQVHRSFAPNSLPDTQNLRQLLHYSKDQQIYGPAVILLHRTSIAKKMGVAVANELLDGVSMPYQLNSRQADPHLIASPQHNGIAHRNGALAGGTVLHHSREVQPQRAIRPLTVFDYAQVAIFGAETGPLAWSLEYPEIWVRIFGVFERGRLVSTCAVRVWGELLAEIYVDTLPTYRRRGYGRAVSQAALTWIHSETSYYAESVVELSNLASLYLMQSIGFEPYAYMVNTYKVN